MENSQQYLDLVSERIQRPGIEDLVDWLQSETDFFTSPASTRFHGSYEGGLVEHSLNVYEQMLFELDSLVGPNWSTVYDPESIAIIALFHDLCKVNRYMIENKWRKDDQGQWESYEAYVYDPEKAEMGHGPQSVYYIQKFIHLTEAEAQAIFWHMGAYDISQYANLNGLSKTFEQNPLAFLIHRADMASTYVLENQNFIIAEQEPQDADEAEEVVRREEAIPKEKEKPAKAKPKGKIVKSKKVEEEPAEEEPVVEEVKPKAKGKSAIRMPKPVKPVEEVEPEPEVVEPETDEEVADVITYWYDAKNEEFYEIEAGEPLPLEDEEVSEEEYLDAMFPILEEDFYYEHIDGTVGVIAEGERLPRDYDEDAYKPITVEEYNDLTEPKEKPAAVAKASRKKPTPSRRPKP